MQLLQREDVPVTIRQREVRIRLKDWSVMAKGEGHIILQNNNPSDELYWKVISICIHNIEPTFQQIQRLYFEILAEMPGISQYLIQRDPIELGQEEKQAFKQFLKGALKENHDIGQRLMMHLAENLNRAKQEWQYALEFKPKSAIPDRYSQKFTDNISQKTGIPTTKLLKTLNTRPVHQKTRWFKKELSHKTKKNMNPLDIFGITPQRQPNIIHKLSRIHNLEGNMDIPNDRHGLLNQIILQQLRRSHILENVARLQLLFTGPNEFTSPQLPQIWSRQQDKQAALAKLKKGVMQVLNRNINTLDEISSLLSLPVLQQPILPLDQDQQLLDMFKFLISLSWRDVSLFIRIKTNPENTTIEAIDFKFLDYQLKQSAKLKKTIVKDEKLLLKYLEYLGKQ